MARNSKYRKIGLQILRFFVILICIVGFLYQAMEFMYLYWTYPTVVDIQQSTPSDLEAPAISICNPLGYNFTNFCEEFETGACLPPSLRKYTQGKICESHPMNCRNNELAEDYYIIRFNKFTEAIEVQPEDHKLLSIKLENYLNCTIEVSGEEKPCNMDYVRGSFYSREELHQYCYTLYSLWGQPEKKRERFPKGAIVKLHFFLNASLRDVTYSSDGEFLPKYTLPSSPGIQIALHSPYHLPSPYLEGNNFLVGRSYAIRLKMNENHLLPAPYQTNCTNYLEEWKLRGGKAPMNQMDVVQECRMKRYYERLGCVPKDVDYPHDYPICKVCEEKNCDNSGEVKSSVDSCQNLVGQYNQPCDSISYTITKEQKMISFLQELELPSVNKSKEKDVIRWRIAQHDCSGTNMWKIECSTIDIDILFDRFEITTLTYNPKYESLELFSVIGGYLGMWLGISLVTVYDFISSIIKLIHKYRIRLSHKRKQGKAVRKIFYTSNNRDFMA